MQDGSTIESARFASKAAVPIVPLSMFSTTCSIESRALFNFQAMNAQERMESSFLRFFMLQCFFCFYNHEYFLTILYSILSVKNQQGL